MNPKKYAAVFILIALFAIMGGCVLHAESAPSPADSPTFPLVLNFEGTSTAILVSPTPAATPTPEPTPTPVPSPPAFTPDPDVVNFIVKGNPFTNPQWLFPQTTDPTEPPGASRFSTFLISTFEPHITKDGATWRITFEP